VQGLRASLDLQELGRSPEKMPGAGVSESTLAQRSTKGKVMRQVTGIGIGICIAIVIIGVADYRWDQRTFGPIEAKANAIASAGTSDPTAQRHEGDLVGLFLNNFDLRRAERKAEAYCQRLECAVPITVVLMPVRTEFPDAHTTIGPGGSCLIHMTKTSVLRDDIIAHEVCHCAQDYAVLGEYGYTSAVTESEVNRREARARFCAGSLANAMKGAGR